MVTWPQQRMLLTARHSSSWHVWLALLGTVCCSAGCCPTSGRPLCWMAQKLMTTQTYWLVITADLMTMPWYVPIVHPLGT